MKSSIRKHSIVIDGHKTSLSLEDAFWNDLKGIAQNQRTTLSELVANINRTRQLNNLSSTIRMFVLEHFLKQHKPTESANIDYAGVNGEKGQALQP